MAEVLKLSIGEIPFRVRFDPPFSDSIGTCLLIQSGQLGSYDEPSQEVLLQERLVQSLTRNQIGVLRLDMERRENGLKPADGNHLSARTKRVRQLINEPGLKPHLGRYVMCGFSLGAQTVLQLISNPDNDAGPEPCGVVLIGCVVESPITVMSSLRTVKFLYGARDYIAYIREDGIEPVAIPPEVYGQQSLDMLITRPRQTCSIDIADGLNHLLLTGDDEERHNLAVPWLSEEIKTILLGEDSRVHS